MVTTNAEFRREKSFASTVSLDFPNNPSGATCYVSGLTLAWVSGPGVAAPLTSTAVLKLQSWGDQGSPPCLQISRDLLHLHGIQISEPNIRDPLQSSPVSGPEPPHRGHRL
ncbi:uncharacterized protein LOC144225980 isoform X2 [Crocuta crocuta]